MPRTNRYYLSRLTKAGTLTKAKIIEALQEPLPIQSTTYAWTIIDFKRGYVTRGEKRVQFWSGYLTKYDPNATVEVVDDETRTAVEVEEPNLQRAKALFVYFPEFECFGHQHLWDKIKAEDFRCNVASLIETFHGKFFVECEIVPISDYLQFVDRLAAFDGINQIHAKVRPPNPLFSPFWKKLKEYLDDRNISQMTIDEKTKGDALLKSTIPSIAQSLKSSAPGPEESAPTGDAAVLMAAAGYGTATVTGRVGNKTTVVKTEDSVVIFKLPQDVSEKELANQTLDEIERVNKQGRLSH